MIPYFCSFTNNYSHTVVYKYAIANFCTGVYFNSCQTSAQMA